MEKDNTSIKSCQSKMSVCDCNCEKCQEICICQDCSKQSHTENENKKKKRKHKIFRWKNKSRREKDALETCEICIAKDSITISKTELEEPVQETKKKKKFFKSLRKHKPKNNSSPTEKKKKKGIFKYSKKKPIQRESFNITKELKGENNDNEMKEADNGNDTDTKKSPLLHESSASNSFYIESLPDNNEDKSEKKSEEGNPYSDKKAQKTKKNRTFLKKLLHDSCCCF